MVSFSLLVTVQSCIENIMMKKSYFAANLSDLLERLHAFDKWPCTLNRNLTVGARLGGGGRVYSYTCDN